MKELNFDSESQSKSEIIASSGPFQIERIIQVGNNDFESLILISESLVNEFGPKARLTPKTIELYFNRSGSLPFIARYQKEIIGYIIGLPLEILSTEPWARLDTNFQKQNTIYTYAFVIMNQFKGNGYAKMLKRVYLNWAKKQNGVLYITGHVLEGVASKFKGNIKILERVNNWQGTGKTFEYYRRLVDPDKIYNEPSAS